VALVTSGALLLMNRRLTSISPPPLAVSLLLLMKWMMVRMMAVWPTLGTACNPLCGFVVCGFVACRPPHGLCHWVRCLLPLPLL